MNEQQSSRVQWGMTIVFGIAQLLFWRLFQPEMLYFHEGFQLFIFDTAFAAERLLTCGGLAIYIGEFITQFFASLWLGASLIALVFVAIQLLTWKLAKQNGADNRHYPLSFIPAIILWLHMSDSNVMVAYLVSIAIALCAMVGYTAIKSDKKRLVTLIVSIPLLLASISIGTYVFVIYVMTLMITRSNNRLKACGYAIATAVYTIICVIVTYRFSSFELWRIATGIYFYRVKIIIGWRNVILTPIIGAMPFAIAYFRLFKKSQFMRVFAYEMIIIAIGTAFALHKSYTSIENQLVEYDYLVRIERWDKIIEKVKKNHNETVFETLALNLALASQGQLSERLFEFKQHGAEGLIPPFPNDNATIILAAEIYLRIGMVNVAQRTYFEAQENIMTDVKSGRLTKRLAEMCIINGEYKVAQKYIDLLKKTFKYRKWALKNEKLLGKEKKIKADPFYGEMRKKRAKDDFFYNEDIPDQIAGHHFEQNRENLVALDYALCYMILNGNVNEFIQTYDAVSRIITFNYIPKAHQETLAYAWRQRYDTFDHIPWNLSPITKNNFEAFVQIYNMNKNDERIINGPLSQTVWGYFAHH